MNATCQCGEPLPDMATIGPRCVSQLMQDLGEMPGLVDELMVTLSRQDRVRIGGGKQIIEPDELEEFRKTHLPAHLRSPVVAAYAPAAKSPVHGGASDLLIAMRVTLGGWVAVLHLGDQWPQDDLTSMSRWLLARIQRIVGFEAGGDLAGEVHGLAVRARHVIDSASEKLYAGPCHADGGKCKEELYATKGHEEMTCPACGTEWSVAQRQEWLRAAAEDHLGTAWEISALCRHMLGDLVTVAMIRGYAHRGTLVSHGHADHRGRQVPIFRVGDVLATATKAAESPQSRRAAKRDAREAEEAERGAA